MDATKLDRRLTLQRATVATDAFGGRTETWSDLATVFAERRDVSDAERLRSQEIGATISTRFRIRYAALWADLSPTDRVVCEGRTFDVVGVKEIERRRGLEISAIARAE